MTLTSSLLCSTSLNWIKDHTRVENEKEKGRRMKWQTVNCFRPPLSDQDQEWQGCKAHVMWSCNYTGPEYTFQSLIHEMKRRKTRSKCVCRRERERERERIFNTKNSAEDWPVSTDFLLITSCWDFLFPPLLSLSLFLSLFFFSHSHSYSFWPKHKCKCFFLRTFTYSPAFTSRWPFGRESFHSLVITQMSFNS